MSAWRLTRAGADSPRFPPPPALQHGATHLAQALGSWRGPPCDQATPGRLDAGESHSCCLAAASFGTASHCGWAECRADLSVLTHVCACGCVRACGVRGHCAPCAPASALSLSHILCSSRPVNRSEDSARGLCTRPATASMQVGAGPEADAGAAEARCPAASRRRRRALHACEARQTGTRRQGQAGSPGLDALPVLFRTHHTMQPCYAVAQWSSCRSLALRQAPGAGHGALAPQRRPGACPPGSRSRLPAAPALLPPHIDRSAGHVQPQPVPAALERAGAARRPFGSFSPSAPPRGGYVRPCGASASAVAERGWLDTSLNRYRMHSRDGALVEAVVEAPPPGRQGANITVRVLVSPAATHCTTPLQAPQRTQQAI